MTKYVVLQMQDAKVEPGGGGGGVSAAAKGGWAVVGTYEARSDKNAITAHCTKTQATAGIFVAVPERSWKPVPIRAQTRIAFE